jgi:hypothetical protein
MNERCRGAPDVDASILLCHSGYGGYDGVVVGNDIARAGCWAHTRRRFVDAEKAQPVIAAAAVGIIVQHSIPSRARFDHAKRRTLDYLDCVVSQECKYVGAVSGGQPALRPGGIGGGFESASSGYP